MFYGDPCPTCEFVAEMDINQLDKCECNRADWTACCQELPIYNDDEVLVCRACNTAIAPTATTKGWSYA